MQLIEAVKLIDDHTSGATSMSATEIAIKIHDSAQNDCDKTFTKLKEEVAYWKLSFKKQMEANRG